MIHSANVYKSHTHQHGLAKARAPIPDAADPQCLIAGYEPDLFREIILFSGLRNRVCGLKSAQPVRRGEIANPERRWLLMIRKFDAFMNTMASWASFLGAIWIFIIMVFICIDVVYRLFLNDPIIGTPEIVQNSLAGIAFLMLPWATHLGQHVRSTMIKDKLSRRGGLALDIIAFLFGTALFAAIAAASWRHAVRATQILDFQGEGLRVPIYPVWWVIIFGASLSCYQCVSKVVRAILLIRGARNIESLREHGGIQI